MHWLSLQGLTRPAPERLDPVVLIKGDGGFAGGVLVDRLMQVALRRGKELPRG